MKYHQGIRAEIETRSKNFNACLELGESLLKRQHEASEEVRETAEPKEPSPCLYPYFCGAKQRPGRDFPRRLVFLFLLEHQ